MKKERKRRRKEKGERKGNYSIQLGSWDRGQQDPKK